MVYTEAQTLQLAAAADQLQTALHDRDVVLQVAQQEKQAAMHERDALRTKVEQQKVELTHGLATAQELRAAAADLADELQAVRSMSGRQAGQQFENALQELSAEHAACLRELAAKSAAVEDLNASVTQLHAELAENAAQQAQHEQDSTGQQAEFVGQVLQELQVLEAALLQKGQECDFLSQQCIALKADSHSQLGDLVAQLEAQMTTTQQLRQELKAQHAQRQELVEKVLALDAQAAYTQHKLDAVSKEAAAANQSREVLQAELQKVQQHFNRQPQSSEASTSTSEDFSEAAAQQQCPKGQVCRAQEEMCGDQAHASQTLEVPAAQQQPSPFSRTQAHHNQDTLLLEADAQLEAEDQCSSRKQSELGTVHIAGQPSTFYVQRLEGQVADLQSEMLSSAAQRKNLQQQLAQCMQELDTAQALLVSRQHAAESLQQTQAHGEAALAQAEAQQQWSQQAAADRQSLVDLQHELAAAQEDKAALLALPQPDTAASKLELQQSRNAVQDLENKLADQRCEIQSLKEAAQVADADGKQLLKLLEQAQLAVAAAEQRLEQASNGELAAATAAHEQLQEQLQQDRDSLMEEVLSAKARAADQERVIQSLRVAADASAREMMLLSNQLDATEQQFASQAQELLQQQREAQRLQAALKDQSVHLKKAKFIGSSNDQGLRGMQQRLQEALQDQRAAELQVQRMQSQLQQAETALSQVSCKTHARVMLIHCTRRGCPEAAYLRAT